MTARRPPRATSACFGVGPPKLGHDPSDPSRLLKPKELKRPTRGPSQALSGALGGLTTSDLQGAAGTEAECPDGVRPCL